MATLSDLRSIVSDNLNRTDLNTQIDQAINFAIDYYAKRYRFWFNETTATFNTVASQFNYTSAETGLTNVREFDYVKIAISSTNNYEVVPETYDVIQSINISNATGQPIFYSYYKENMYLYYVPDAAYTITVSYVKSYSDLVNDGDSNDFTTNAEDLIEPI